MEKLSKNQFLASVAVGILGGIVVGLRRARKEERLAAKVNNLDNYNDSKEMES